MDSEEQVIIIAGSGVGKFRLGSQLNDVISLMSNEFPRTNMDVDVINKGNGDGDDIHLSVPEWGIRLRFQTLSQKLFMIDIVDFEKIRYSFNGSIIGGQDEVMTLKSLRKALGPSFPGYFVDDSLYLLEFDGISLMFSVPLQFKPAYSTEAAIPVDLPDGSSPTLYRIYVHPIDLKMKDLGCSYPDRLPFSTDIQLICNSDSLERGRPRVQLINLDDNREGKIFLGMTPQEIVSNMGNPDVCTLNSPASSDPHSQRYEYSQLGLELFFTRKAYLLYRVVFHTNVPFHQEFGHYNRCGFRIHGTVIQAFEETFSKANEEGAKKKSAKNGATTVSFIDPSTTWREAEIILTSWLEAENLPAAPPVAAIKPVPAGCPLPPTKLFGYPQLYSVFEVSDSDRLVSVTILDPQILRETM